MTQFDFVKAFYEGISSRESIVAEIDAVLSSRPREIQVTAIPFSTDRIPDVDFLRLRTGPRKLRLLKSLEGLSLFELEYSYKDGRHKRTDSGRFLVCQHPTYPHVFAALTIESGAFVRRGLLPFLRNRFPYVIVGFLPQARLNRLLSEFRSDCKFSELIVTRATQRLRLPDEGTHRRVMPVMSWPDMALGEAIDWLVEHNGWFQSIQFEAKRDRHTITRVSLTREGLVRCDYLFEQVWNAFVLPICKMHHVNFNLGS